MLVAGATAAASFTAIAIVADAQQRIRRCRVASRLSKMYLFLARGREQNPPRWLETKAALEAGDDVLTDLRNRAEAGDTCAPN